MSSCDFEENWGYGYTVKNMIEGATAFDINPTQLHFKSGRPKFEATFYCTSGGRRCVLEKRDVMELTNKKTGEPYFVVSRKEREEAIANHDTVNEEIRQMMLSSRG